MRVFLVSLLSSVLLMACAEGGNRLAWMSGGASDDPVKSAESAGPASLAKSATIMDLSGTVLREGSNGWTCIPDNPEAEGTDPWCYNDAWANLRAALMSGGTPSYDTVGIAYMLAGDSPVSNTDPSATSFTSDEDWVTGLGAHLMIVVPGENALAGYSTDAHHGGPWIMWPGTPFEHLMVPIDSYGGE